MEYINGIPILGPDFDLNEVLKWASPHGDMDIVEIASPGLLKAIEFVSDNTVCDIYLFMVEQGFVPPDAVMEKIYLQMQAGMFTLFGGLMAQASRDAESNKPSG